MNRNIMLFRQLKVIAETYNCTDNESYKFKFDVLPYSSDRDTFGDKGCKRCLHTPIIVGLELTDKFGSRRTAEIKVLDTLVHGEKGYRLGNEDKDIKNINKKCIGWSIVDESKKSLNIWDTEKSSILSYKSDESGTEVKKNSKDIYLGLSVANNIGIKFSLLKNNKIEVSRSYGNHTKKASLVEFLKAFTGDPIDVIRSEIGEGKFLSLSLEDDVSMSTAINQSYSLSSIYTEDTQFGQESNKSLKFRRYFGSAQTFDLGITTRNKYNKAHSFENRIVGFTLTEPLDIGGTVYREGTTVTLSMAKALDESNITKLVLKNDDKLVTVVSHKTNSQVLTKEELYTALNRFDNYLSGNAEADNEFAYGEHLSISVNNYVVEEFNKRLSKMYDILINSLEDTYMKFSSSSLEEEARDYVGNELKQVLDSMLANIERDESFTRPSILENYMESNARKATGPSSDASAFSKQTRSNATVVIATNVATEKLQVSEDQFLFGDVVNCSESVNAGKTVEKTLESVLSDDSMVGAPVLNVKTGALEFIKPHDLKDVYIVQDSSFKDNEYASVYHNGKFKKVKSELVTHKLYSCYQFLSLSRATLPFVEYQALKRQLMGGKYITQCLTTLLPCERRVSTLSEIFADNKPLRANSLITEYVDGIMTSMEDDSYYNLEGIKEVVDEIELVLSTVVEVEGGDYATYVLDFEYNGKTHSISKTLTYNQSNDVNSLNTMRYNYENIQDNRRGGLSFKGNDIVFYHCGYTINSREIIDDFIELGGRELDPADLDFRATFGTDFKVGFLSYEGYCIEDGAAPSSKALYQGKFAHISVKDIKVEVKASREDITKNSRFFGITQDFHQPSYITSLGLPKVGTTIEAGDILACRLVDTTDKEGKPIKRVSVREATFKETGQVTSAYIKPNEPNVAIIKLAAIKDGSPGDKIAGLHGNKGTLTTMIDDTNAIRVARTGEILDLCLNPLGVTGRNNFSQLAESLAGKLAEETGKNFIVTPYYPDSFKKLVDMCIKEGILLEEKVIDGRDGIERERKAFVGTMHMLKLHHTVDKKCTSIGLSDSINPRNNAPVDGQKLGEMEKNGIISHSAMSLLNSFLTYHSDDISAAKLVDRSLMTTGEFPKDLDVKSLKSNNGNSLLEIARTLCMNLTTDSEGVTRLGFMKDEDIMSLGDRGVESEEDIDSARIFVIGKGNSDKDNRSTRNLKKARKAWSHMALTYPIINPMFLSHGSNLGRLLAYAEVGENSVKLKTCSTDTISGIVNGTHRVFSSSEVYKHLDSGEEKNPVLTTIIKSLLKARNTLQETTSELSIESLSTIFNNELPVIIKADSSEGTSNVEGVIKLLKDTKNYDAAKAHYKYRLNKLINELKPSSSDKCIIDITPDRMQKSSRDIVKISKYLTMIDNFDKIGFKPEDFILNYIPVMPYISRQANEEQNLFNDRTKGYKNILKASIAKKGSSVLYKEFCTMLGTMKTDKNIQSYISEISGSGSEGHGAFREEIQAKQLHFSARSTISPMVDLNGTIDEVGLPLQVCCEMFKSIGVYTLRNEIEEFKIFANERSTDKDFKKIVSSIGYKNLKNFKYIVEKLLSVELTRGEAKHLMFTCRKKLENIFEQQVVIYLRNPVLHKQSILGAKVKMSTSDAIQIHPTVCPGFNADFDGDSMAVFAVLNPEDKKYVLDHMLASKVPFKERNGGVILALTQDSLHGIYEITTLKDNAYNIKATPEIEAYYKSSMVHFNVMSELVEAYELELLPHYILATVNYRGNTYLSTLGRLYLNYHIPGAMTDAPFQNKLGLDLSEESMEDLCEIEFDAVIAKRIKHKDGTSKSHEGLEYKTLDSIMEILTSDLSTLEETVSKLTRIGFVANQRSITSIGPKDLEIAFEKDYGANIFNKSKRIIEVEHRRLLDALNLGILSESEVNTKITELVSALHGMCANNILSVVDRNSNNYRIVDSGSRGDENNLMSSIGFIGLATDNNDATIPLPILNSYSSGPEPFENSILAYGARIGLLATQLTTPEVGYMSRILGMTLDGIRVVEEDCHANSEEASLPLTYGKINNIVYPSGNILDISNYRSDRYVVKDVYKKYYGKVINVSANNLKSTLGIDTRSVEFNEDFLLLVEDRNTYGEDIPLQFKDGSKTVIKTTLLSTLNENNLGELLTGFRLRLNKDNEDGFIVENGYTRLDSYHRLNSMLTENNEEVEPYYYSEQNIDKLLKPMNRDTGIVTTINKIHEIETSLGTIRLNYELSDHSKSSLKSRIRVETDNDGNNTYKPVLQEDIERLSIDNKITYSFRNMLTCKSRHGVCSICAGYQTKPETTYDKTIRVNGEEVINYKEIYPVNYNIGMIAALHLSQELAQKTISSINTGGNSVSGIDQFKKMLNNSVHESMYTSVMSPRSGVLTLEETGDYVHVYIDGELQDNKTLDKDHVVVVNGQYINMNEQLTDGFLDWKYYNKVLEKEYRENQLNRAIAYYDLYTSTSKDTLARLFEPIIRAQNNHLKLLNVSKNGHIVDTPDELKDCIMKDEECSVLFEHARNHPTLSLNLVELKPNRAESIGLTGGSLNRVSYERPIEGIVELAMTGQEVVSYGVEGKVFGGYNPHTGEFTKYEEIDKTSALSKKNAKDTEELLKSDSSITNEEITDYSNVSMNYDFLTESFGDVFSSNNDSTNTVEFKEENKEEKVEVEDFLSSLGMEGLLDMSSNQDDNKEETAGKDSNTTSVF